MKKFIACNEKYVKFLDFFIFFFNFYTKNWEKFFSLENYCALIGIIAMDICSLADRLL